MKQRGGARKLFHIQKAVFSQFSLSLLYVLTFDDLAVALKLEVGQASRTCNQTRLS